MYNGLIVVSYAPRRRRPGDGGFCCRPGQPQEQPALPGGLQDVRADRRLARPGAPSGRLGIIFTEALTHGTWPWNADPSGARCSTSTAPGTCRGRATYPAAAEVPDASPPLERILQPPYVQQRASVLD